MPPLGAENLEEAASGILDAVPSALAGPALAFEPIIATDVAGRVGAIDGGSTIVLDVRSTGLYCVRAGYCLRDADGSFHDRTTTRGSRTLARSSAAHAWRDMLTLHGWGVDVPAPTLDAARIVPQLAESERVLAEYNAARRCLLELRQGDLMLLDGSLDDEDRNGALRDSILDRAAERGVLVAAVSKDSSLSLGGVLPLPLEIEELAIKQGMPTPWMCDVTLALGRDTTYRTFVARFDARAPAFRVDVVGDPITVLARVAAHCDDAAYAGYPYPLARVHDRVHYEAGEALDLRRHLEEIVARRRGHRVSARLFGKGRDVLQLAE